MHTVDMLVELFTSRQKDNQTTPVGFWSLLVSFAWLGLWASAGFALFFVILAATLGGNLPFWLAVAFGLLTIGEAAAFGLTNFRQYLPAAITLGASLLFSFIILLAGNGLSGLALAAFLANLLITLSITQFLTFSRAEMLGEESVKSSDLMIAVGRLENELELIKATLDSLEEGLLLTDTQDKVLRSNTRLNFLFGLRPENSADEIKATDADEAKDKNNLSYSNVNEWINQVRDIASNPDDFKASIASAREMVRLGETSVFVFGIEKLNPRYRATEPVVPRPRLPEGAADGGPSFGRNQPLLRFTSGSNEPETFFEKDTRELLYREMQLTVFPVRGAKGNLLGICYLARDVTEEREVEQMKENFISIVSHEVRTPMAVILGLTELLALPNIERSEQEEWLTAINQEALRLRTVLNDMQSISHIKDGALELSLEEVELKELIERVAKVSQLQYRSHHEVEINFDIDNTTVLADRGKVTQVLTNLIGNAIKYTPEDGQIKIRVGMRPNQASQLYISITDQGIGIPKSEQHKVFSRFFRSTNTRQKGIGGTGLGLAITQHLVKLMGGTVWFESEENEGSTFYFSLPLATPENPILDSPERFSNSY